MIVNARWYQTLILQQFLQLGQRYVRGAIHRIQDYLRISFDASRPAVATLALRRNLSVQSEFAAPSAHARRAHLETQGSLPTRKTAINRCQNAFAKINR
jgi:hypothetical protein